MHHLGHLFLAEGPPAFQFGAFIADGVRGSFLDSLPSLVKEGVRFHRWVDWQTDRHPAFQAARRLLRPLAGRYAGLLVDFWLDVVLGENWAHFSPNQPFEAFEQHFIQKVLLPHRLWAPPSWQDFLQRLVEQHLLRQFAQYESMLQHIEHFIRRRRLPLSPEQVRTELRRYQAPLAEILQTFWTDALAWRRTAA
ncbi:MAG: ACP phosphodiesterase [Bacteroidia bacterium]|nr:ACP phosphodiesterase [Bacteroidia bacterium]